MHTHTYMRSHTQVQDCTDLEWYKGRVVESAPGQMKLHYVGWSSIWDEYVQCVAVCCSVLQCVAAPGQIKLHFVGWSSIWDEYVLIRSFFFSLSLALVYYLSLSLCCTTHILAIIFPHTHTHILCLSLRCKEQRDRHL